MTITYANTIIITADREPILPTIKVLAEMMRDYLHLENHAPMATVKKEREG